MGRRGTDEEVTEARELALADLRLRGMSSHEAEAALVWARMSEDGYSYRFDLPSGDRVFQETRLPEVLIESLADTVLYAAEVPVG